MAALPDQIRELAAINQAEISVEAATANYPLQGYDGFGFVNVEAIPGFDPRQAYPHVRGSPNGALLFKVVADNVERRGIPVLYQSRAERLLLAADGGIAGVELSSPGKRRQRIGARRGVILAAGGFEANAEMQRQYWPAGPALSAAYKLNTGDGIRMGQGVGADLWHMWHYHGSYGYRHPDPAYPYAIRVKRLPDWRPGEGRATAAHGLDPARPAGPALHERIRALSPGYGPSAPRRIRPRPPGLSAHAGVSGDRRGGPEALSPGTADL